MPGNSRIKYIHKCIVEYIHIGGASYPEIGLIIYIMCIVKYIDLGGVSCLGIGGLNLYITGNFKYIDVGRGFMPRNRGVEYFRKCTVEHTDVGGASCLGNRGLNTFINYVLEYFLINGLHIPGIGRYFEFFRCGIIEGVQRYKYRRINKLHHFFPVRHSLSVE
jgi:hypothetical protein